MKKLLSLMAVLCLFACGDDGDGGNPSGSGSGITLTLRSQSIAEGSEVDASTTTSLTLAYSSMVKVTSDANITLNGTKVTATASVANVTIPLSLTAGTTYTLKVPKGAIVSTSDANVSAPELTINFKTKAKVDPQGLNNDATALTKKLGWGWNLGNHFDTSSDKDGEPNQWGYWDKSTPTQTLYQKLKAAGASTIRIPVTWGNYQSTTDGNWTIDANYMAEVKQNVEWAEAAGLNVILNIHHDEYWTDIKTAASNTTVNENIKARIEKTWKQIAEAFKNKGDFLFFEAFNEVQDGSWGWGANRTDGGKQYRTLNEWNQLVVNTIRATGGNNATRWIGVPGYASGATFVLINEFKLPTDAANHIMVSVHFYDPGSFCLTPVKDGITEWGHTATKGKYVEGSNEDHVVETFQKLQEKFIANNIPVYVGEYGCVLQTSNRSNLFRNYYLEYVCRAAYTYNLPVCLWDNWDAKTTGGGDEHHYYINHNDGRFYTDMESLVKLMIKATTSDDASYTLETVYNSAPK